MPGVAEDLGGRLREVVQVDFPTPDLGFPFGEVFGRRVLYFVANHVFDG